MIEIIEIPKDCVDTWWNKASDYIEQATQYSCGENTLKTVYNELKLGHSLLVIVKEDDSNNLLASSVLNTYTSPTGKNFLEVQFLGGINMEHWIGKYVDKLKRIAKVNCTSAITFVGRKGLEKFLKPLGFRFTHVVSHLEV